MATLTKPQTNDRVNFLVFSRLTEDAYAADSPDKAWLSFEAAHVVGQLYIKPHFLSHVHMLRLAVRTRDWSEAAGQIFRLILVPLGHLSGRLPVGNPGRSTVSAFQPLPVRRELAELISRALETVKLSAA